MSLQTRTRHVDSRRRTAPLMARPEFAPWPCADAVAAPTAGHDRWCCCCMGCSAVTGRPVRELECSKRLQVRRVAGRHGLQVVQVTALGWGCLFARRGRLAGRAARSRARRIRGRRRPGQATLVLRRPVAFSSASLPAPNPASLTHSPSLTAFRPRPHSARRPSPRPLPAPPHCRRIAPLTAVEYLLALPPPPVSRAPGSTQQRCICTAHQSLHIHLTSSHNGIKGACRGSRDAAFTDSRSSSESTSWSWLAAVAWESRA
jgi:hypothetical protein